MGREKNGYSYLEETSLDKNIALVFYRFLHGDSTAVSF